MLDLEMSVCNGVSHWLSSLFVLADVSTDEENKNFPTNAIALDKRIMCHNMVVQILSVSFKEGKDMP